MRWFFLRLISSMVYMFTLSKCEEYLLGDKYTVEWDKSKFTNNVDINLQYEDADKKWASFVVVKDVDASLGKYDVTPNFGTVEAGTLAQLFVPNNTLGNFCVSQNDTSICETNNLTILQPVQIVPNADLEGLVKIDSQFEIDVVVGVDTSDLTWVAELVSLDANGVTWTRRVELTIQEKQEEGITQGVIIGVPKDANINGTLGPLILNIGLKDGNTFNYYTVLLARTFQVYDDSMVKLAWGTSPTVKRYESVPLMVQAGGLEYIWLVAEDDSGKSFGLTCEPQMDSSITGLNWAVVSPSSTLTDNTLPDGKYTLYGYYATSSMTNLTEVTMAGFQFPTISQEFEVSGYMAPTIKVNISEDDSILKKGANFSVDVETIFQDLIGVWRVNDTGKMDLVNNFTAKVSESSSIFVIVPDVIRQKEQTTLQFYALSCDGKLEDALAKSEPVAIKIKGKKSSSSSLSAGAIVGIVCAAVFVFGITVWWVCMKRGGSTDRYTKIDG